MRSTTSFFNLTLYKKDITRFWPLWALYTLAWLFVLPFPILSEMRYLTNYTSAQLAGYVGDRALGLVFNGGIGVTMALGYGILCAMAVWSYLYRSSSANMMHALPLRREGHFLTHFLAGVTFFAGPTVIVFVATLLAGLLLGASVGVGNLFLALGCHILMCLIFFCLATFCAMLTGHQLALPAFYIIFNWLVYGLAMIIDFLAEQFLFGYRASLVGSQFVLWFTPASHLMGDISASYYDPEQRFMSSDLFNINLEHHSEVSLHIDGLHIIFVYVIAGLILAGIALLLYRRRHLETAGDVVAVSWLKPIFLYGVTFCASLSGGVVTYSLFFRGNSGLPTLILMLALFAVIGYFAALMLLKKSLHVFRDGWKGCIGGIAAVLVLCGLLFFDPIGISAKMPNLDEVDAVYVSGISSYPRDSADYFSEYLEDPELIAQAAEIHQILIDERSERRSFNPRHNSVDWTTGTLLSFRIEYMDENLAHTILQRDYNDVWVEERDLEDPNSLASAVYKFVNNKAFLRQVYHFDEIEPASLANLSMNLLNEDGQYHQLTLETPVAVSYRSGMDNYSYPETSGEPADVPVDAEYYWKYEDPQYNEAVISITQAQMTAIWEAVLQDFEDGNLGKRYLFDNEERGNSTCVTDLAFSYQVPVLDENNQIESVYMSDMTITLTPQATKTLQQLKAVGVFENGRSLETNREQPVQIP